MTEDQYIDELNRLFEDQGLALRITWSDLKFFEEFVTDTFDERRISAFLTTAISPPIHEGEFYHYTHSPDKVLDSGVLRLTTVQKRLSEDEIQAFLKRFGFEFPLETEPGRTAPRYHTSIASGIFYTSLTDTSLSESDERYFWETFAGKNGGRLKLKFSLRSGCLRRIMYGDQIERWARLYREISDLTKRSLGKIFFWDNASTVCALHLPAKYHVEKETRLITPRDCGLKVGFEGGFEYVEAKIGDNPTLALKIRLVEIQTNQPVPNSRGANVVPRPGKI